jgi:hypothetical protein
MLRLDTKPLDHNPASKYDACRIGALTGAEDSRFRRQPVNRSQTAFSGTSLLPEHRYWLAVSRSISRDVMRRIAFLFIFAPGVGPALRIAVEAGSEAHAVFRFSGFTGRVDLHP